MLMYRWCLVGDKHALPRVPWPGTTSCTNHQPQAEAWCNRTQKPMAPWAPSAVSHFWGDWVSLRVSSVERITLPHFSWEQWFFGPSHPEFWPQLRTAAKLCTMFFSVNVNSPDGAFRSRQNESLLHLLILQRCAFFLKLWSELGKHPLCLVVWASWLLRFA